MDLDEFFVLIFGSILTLIFTVWWYAPLLASDSLNRPSVIKLGLGLLPPLCLAILLRVLVNFADPQVRNNPGYIILFLATGGAWLLLTTAFMNLLGISVRDDAIERHNPAAAIFIAGGLIGMTILFSGANIGTGPTIWTTIGPAALGTLVLLISWLAHALLTDIPELITVDRDTAAAIRTGGFYLATALILARAVAGDWVSDDATLRDLICQGWPVLVLLVFAVGIEVTLARFNRRTRRALLPSTAVAGTWILLAIAVIFSIAGPLGINSSGAPRRATDTASTVEHR